MDLLVNRDEKPLVGSMAKSTDNWSHCTWHAWTRARVDNGLCNGGAMAGRGGEAGVVASLLHCCSDVVMRKQWKWDATRMYSVCSCFLARTELPHKEYHINYQEQSNMSWRVSFNFCHDLILTDCMHTRTPVRMCHWISNSKKRLLNKWHQDEWNLSKMYKTTTKHISRGPHPQSMPRVRLLIFLLALQ